MIFLLLHFTVGQLTNYVCSWGRVITFTLSFITFLWKEDSGLVLPILLILKRIIFLSITFFQKNYFSRISEMSFLVKHGVIRWMLIGILSISRSILITETCFAANFRNGGKLIGWRIFYCQLFVVSAVVLLIRKWNWIDLIL